jgi:uncharacterized Tic20 family protein
MEYTVSENQKNLGALIHLSTFSKYFFPFANFFAPLLLWTLNKEKPFVNDHGRQAINFQLSILVYTIFIGLLCIPFFMIFAIDFVSLIDAVDHTVHELRYQDIKNLSGYILLISLAVLLLAGLFIFELYAVITATMQATKGKSYKYPLSIPFIKLNTPLNMETNTTEHEHSS